MKFFLTLDMSSRDASFSIFEDDLVPRLITEVSLPSGQTHSESFLPTLADTLSEEALPLKDLSQVIVTYGPGSFTGLRIAYATIKAFATGNAISLTAVHGHEVRALCYLNENAGFPSKEIAVVTQIASARFVETRFLWKARKLELAQEQVVSLPSVTPETLVLSDGVVTLPVGFHHVHYPLRARHLGYAHAQCQLREVAVTPAEKIALSPHYFGASKFD